jgi:predicted amidophosphoribosyltransferase
MAQAVRVNRPGPPMYALSGYSGVARRSVLAYKERGRRELARPFGQLLAAALPSLPGDGERRIVPVPSRPSAARQRGGQHMLLVARNMGETICPVLRLDARAKDSVGLDPAARVANLAGRLSCEPVAPGAEVVLIDDVITTGSTAAACTAALKKAGARVVAVLALTAT